jgi:hypothetical protein
LTAATTSSKNPFGATLSGLSSVLSRKGSSEARKATLEILAEPYVDT